MASRRFRQELAEALPDWERRGWLTEGASEQIRTAYALDKRMRGFGGILLLVFGVLLVVGGIILLLAHNWDQLPIPIRLAAGLLPLTVTAVLGYRVTRNPAVSVGHREAVGLANSLSVALAISITAQVYQISGDLPRFLMTWALCTMPVAWLIGSGLAWLIFQVLLLFWLGETEDRNLLVPVYTPLALLSCAPFLGREWLIERAGTLANLRLPGVILWTVGLNLLLQRVSGSGWFTVVNLSWFGATLAAMSTSSGVSAALCRWLARIGIGGFMIALTFDDFWRRLHFNAAWREKDLHPYAETILTASLPLLLALALVRLWRHMHRTDLVWSACGFAGVIAAAISLQGGDPGISSILSNFVVAAIALLTLRRSLVENDMSRFNLGWLLLSVLILVRFFDSDWGYLARGLVFIGLGVGFLAANFWLKRRGAHS
ncbi:DUF2157 domain-containing protein [Nibricoccus sp. IMCC34717]|uniref:DUF2157 domain-containing protein n=1 Tax=Nibricoccus sp. IMCC34717 TaxID=3034021 RepID=UPI0038510AAD